MSKDRDRKDKRDYYLIRDKKKLSKSKKKTKCIRNWYHVTVQKLDLERDLNIIVK